MKRISLVLASAILLSSTGGAFATDTGGVKISGTVHNTVTADYNDNTARGSYATAKQRVGSIDNADISGNLNNWVYSYDSDNLADGYSAKACQDVGSIGSATDC